MPTNEERREVAENLRYAALYSPLNYYEQFQEAINDCILPEAWSSRNALLERLADLIEPDYTSEESGYFILPKPREPLAIKDHPINGSLYEIINENAREWQKQIEEDIQQRLFETFRKTCKNVGRQMTCSECGAHVYGAIYEHSFVNENGNRVYTTANKPKWNYCPNCGAKVVNDDNQRRA